MNYARRKMVMEWLSNEKKKKRRKVTILLNDDSLRGELTKNKKKAAVA